MSKPATKSKKANGVRVATPPEPRASRDLTAPEGFAWLTIDQISPDPNNARKTFDEADLLELADSMAAKGLLQKPAVRPANEDGLHQLVAGERRTRAWALLVHRGTWPEDHVELCPIIEGDDAFASEAGLIENLQRKDLRPLEEARGFQRLIEVHGHTTATIAEKVGFTQRFVQQRLQMLELKPADMTKLEKGEITIEDARRRLANYPKPLGLSDAAWLLPLELSAAVRMSSEAEGGGRYLFIDPQATETAEWKELAAFHGLVQGPNSEWADNGGGETGRKYVTTSYYTAEQLALRFGELASMPNLRRALEAARVAAGVAEGKAAMMTRDDKVMVNAWLTATTEISQEKQAEIAATIAERQRQEDEREFQQAEHAKRVGEAFNVMQSVRTQAAKAQPKPLDTRIPEALAAAGHPTPWSIAKDGSIYAADGKAVIRTNWMGEPPRDFVTRQWAIALAVNAAAGVLTPDSCNADNLDRGPFVAAMAQAIAETEGGGDPARAGDLLDTFLADNTIAYGDDGMRWDREAAIELVDQLLDAEGQGEGDRDTDDTPAIAAEDLEDTDEDAINPAHLKFVGVKDVAATLEPVE